jgi:hypothetical protein
MKQTFQIAFISMIWMVDAVSAHAEIRGADCIELTIANADLVVRGSVVSVSSLIDESSVEKARFKVEESLKGDSAREIEFTVEKPSDWAQYEGKEMLLCLLKNGRDWTLLNVTFLDAPKRIYTMDLAVLTDKAAVLKAFRDATSFSAGNPKPEKLKIKVSMSSPVFYDLYGGSSVFITVPIDSRLNALARKWIRSNDRELKEDAVMAFSYFKDDLNIVLLKQALKDPAYVTLYPVSFPRNDSSSKNALKESATKPPKRYYSVRAKAYETLQKWGIDVSKPLIEQPEADR